MNRPETKALCMDWLDALWVAIHPDEQEDFLEMDEEDLVELNSSLCRDMRNENNLWHMDPKVIGHPDDFSMEVLHSFWEEKKGI